MAQRSAEELQFLQDIKTYFKDRIWLLAAMPVRESGKPDWVLVLSDWAVDKEVEFYNDTLDEGGLCGFCDGKEEFLEMDPFYLVELATTADIVIGNPAAVLDLIGTGALREEISREVASITKDLEYNLWEGQDISLLVENLEHTKLILDAIALYLARMGEADQNRAKTEIPPLKSGIDSTVARIKQGETVDLPRLCRCLAAWLKEWA